MKCYVLKIKFVYFERQCKLLKGITVENRETDNINPMRIIKTFTVHMMYLISSFLGLNQSGQILSN
jgi:hypothetical protein